MDNETGAHGKCISLPDVHQSDESSSSILSAKASDSDATPVTRDCRRSVSFTTQARDSDDHRSIPVPTLKANHSRATSTTLSATGASVATDSFLSMTTQSADVVFVADNQYPFAETPSCCERRNSSLLQQRQQRRLHKCSDCDRVVINVSGQRFETQARTLNRYPNSLLGNPRKRARYWDKQGKEFFLERHRPSFQAILYFYQSGGRLRRPMEVPEDVFLEEIIFYELGPEVVMRYRQKERCPVRGTNPLPEAAWRRRLWFFSEMPESGIAAKIFAFTSVVVVLISILNFCLETMPYFSRTSCSPRLKDSSSPQVTDLETAAGLTGVDGPEGKPTKFGDDKSLGDRQNDNDRSDSFYEGDPIIYQGPPGLTDPFFIVEAMTVLWFTFELVVRFMAWPTKSLFFRHAVNIFDIVAVLPFYFVLIIQQLILHDYNTCEEVRKSGAYIILRLLRVLRIFKLAKHSRGLRVLGLTIQTCIHQLWVFTFLLLVGTVIFSSFVYHAESGDPRTPITSIPAGFWWAIVTLTTVGYGDVTPISWGGRLVGTLCVISGVLTVALPLPIFVANFNQFYRLEMRLQQTRSSSRDARDSMEARGIAASHGRR